MNGIAIRDLLEFKYLSGLQFSPNGRYAAFVVHRGDEEQNGYSSNIWLYNVADAACRQLTAFDREASLIWEDDEYILFPSARQEKDKKEAEKGEAFTVYYRISIHGGEAIEAFRIPLQAHSLRKAYDGTYVVLAGYDPSRDHLEGLEGEERAKALEQLKKNGEDFEILDEIPFWANGEGFTNKKRSRIYRYDPLSGEVDAVTGPLFAVERMAMDKEGARLAFTGQEFDNCQDMVEGLYMYDLKKSKAGQLIEERRFTYHDMDFIGDAILFAGAENKTYGINENPNFYTVNIETGETALLAEYDRSMGSSVATDVQYSGGIKFKAEGDTLYFISTVGHDANLYALSLDGTIRQITGGKGAISCFDVAGGNILFIGLRGLALQELYTLDKDSGAEDILTAFNSGLFASKALSAPEPLSFTASDGLSIEGWVLKPLDYEEGKAYPGIIDIHGGPKTAYGTVYFHEMQVWAAQGYFVFFCNPRGGDGRGDGFADIRGRYGQEDYRDLMEFTDRVLTRYPAIDPKRLGVTGGSYGGFMTNWIVGHTDRFAAAASQRSISNWVTMEHTSDIGHVFALDQMAASTWTDPEKMWDHSPLKYAHQCKTPTLFIHSREDYRCWEVEAIQMFTALKLHGVDSRMCLFKEENHELSRSGKPRRRIRRLEEITDWFEKYLK